LWSVGDSPLSYTSAGHHFSAFHRDIAFRNYIVYALNESVNTLNIGVQQLTTRPRSDNLQLMKMLPLTNLSSLYSQVKTLWTEVAIATSKLDFVVATTKAREVQQLSRRFRALTSQTSEMIELNECTPVRQEFDWDWLISLCIAADVTILLAFVLFNRKRKKVKIN